MNIDDLKQRIKPFMHTYKTYTPKDLVSFSDILKDKQDYSYLSRYIEAEDVLGYCQVHDIDLNIYRYFISVEATEDFFDKASLEWNLILNGYPVDIYSTFTHKIDINHIEERIPTIAIPQNNPKYPLTSSIKWNTANIEAFALGTLPTDINDKEDYEKQRDDIYNILKYTIDKSDNTIPIMVERDEEIYTEQKKYFPMLYTRYFPNVKRYIPVDPNIKEPAIPTEYDDDTTNHMVFKEDRYFSNKYPLKTWDRYKIAIIHGFLYIFYINPGDVPKELFCLEPKFEDSTISFNAKLETDSSILSIPLIIENGVIKTSQSNTDITLKIREQFITLNNSIPSIEDYIFSRINHRLDSVNATDEQREGILSLLSKDNRLTPEFICYFLSEVSLMGTIYLDDTNVDIKELLLWDLSHPRVDKITEKIHIIYRGDFDNTIRNFIEMKIADEEIPETHYRDEIAIFNELTQGRCVNKLVDKFTIDKAISLPEGWDAYNPDRLADYLISHDYDLFISWDKVKGKNNTRLTLADADLIDVTEQDLHHIKFDRMDLATNKFFKLSFPNFKRDNIDLYICNILYTGSKIVEREHHWTYVYIPVTQLYKFLYTHELTDFFFDPDDNEETREVLNYV